MKNQNPYLNFSSFVLRSPLFPFDFIKDLASGKDITEEQILEVCQKPEVEEAIFLASPDLHAQLHERLNGSLTDKKKVKRLHYALMRYILRMSTRPTPFGLFAGFNVGQWEKETNIELPPREKYTRHTRLDMNYLCALAQDLAKNPDIKEKIKYFPQFQYLPGGRSTALRGIQVQRCQTHPSYRGGGSLRLFAGRPGCRGKRCFAKRPGSTPGE